MCKDKNRKMYLFYTYYGFCNPDYACVCLYVIRMIYNTMNEEIRGLNIRKHPM